LCAFGTGESDVELALGHTCNCELMDVPVEEVRLDSENVFLTKIKY